MVGSLSLYQLPDSYHVSTTVTFLKAYLNKLRLLLRLWVRWCRGRCRRGNGRKRGSRGGLRSRRRLGR